MIKKYLLIAVFVACLCGSAGATDYVVMIQQTPLQGGVVTPGAGVHNVKANGAMSITATPRAGYQFVYWMGDVSDPTSQTTMVAVNAPKMVIAVFQRSEYDLPFQERQTPDSTGGGGGGLVANQQSVGGGGGASPGSSYPKIKIPKAPETPENKEPPVPTPEPATMLLLGLGTLLAMKRKNSQV